MAVDLQNIWACLLGKSPALEGTSLLCWGNKAFAAVSGQAWLSSHPLCTP